MSKIAEDSTVVTVSVAVYRLLLIVYPVNFRKEYGPHMLQVFRDYSRRSNSRSGLPGMLWLWVVTIIDLVKTMVDEHLQRELRMTREKMIRWSGWALIGGGIAFTLGVAASSLDPQWSDPLGGKDALIEYTELGMIVLSHLLFAIGLMGLHTRYADEIGPGVRAVLLIGVAGALTALVGSAMLETTDADWAWTAWLSGIMAMMTSLVVFGITASRRDLMPRWNWSPILAGFWLPIVFLIQLAMETFTGQSPNLGDWGFFIVSVLSMMGFIALGLTLQRDQGADKSVA